MTRIEAKKESRFASLTRLITPFDNNSFLRNYWAKMTLHVSRNDPQYFAPLFSLKQLDRAIGYSMAMDYVYFMKNGVTKPVFSPLNNVVKSLAEVYDEFSKGHSLMVRFIHLRCRAVGELNNAIATEFGFNAHTNVYALPPHADALEDVEMEKETFFLQIAGTMIWVLQTPGLDHQTVSAQPGDSLYLPAGTTIQTASAGNEVALVLGVKIQAKTYRDLVVQAIALLAEKDAELRKDLPLGMVLASDREEELRFQIQERLIPKLTGLDWETAKNGLSFTMKSLIPPLPDGHFPQLRHVKDIGLETMVERRPGAVGELRFLGNLAEFQFPGNYQTAPEKMFLAMDFVKTNKKFKVKDVPGWYSENEKIIWVQHLVRKGFLRIV